MSLHKRNSGLVDIFGNCFDCKQPAVLAHFTTTDDVDCLDIWFPIVHHDQDSLTARFPLEQIYADYMKRKKLPPPTDTRVWRNQFANPLSGIPTEPLFRGPGAEDRVMVSGLTSFVEVDVHGKMMVKLSGLTKLPRAVRPSGVLRWVV